MRFLETQQVRVRYGTQNILHGLDLQAERGTLTALLGASGSGKTTLLRAIAGFTSIESGRVLLDGADITRLPPERRRMAMVFQSYALWPHMSTAQNIGYGLRLRRMPKREIAAKVSAMLALLDLNGLGERGVTQLSGGQRQRVALGRALAVDPDVLLLDEPLSNLDARIRVELRQEIRALQRRLGITAVHVTHDREEAMVMADRVVVLREGRVAQEGTPVEVYHRPANPFVARFMGAENVVRVEARGDPTGIRIAASGEETALPLGDGGVYLAAGGPDGRFDAYFRGSAARLVSHGAALPAGTIGLPGRILATSYPGDHWRYEVSAAGQRFSIDDATRFAEDDAVRVSVPAAALHLFPA